MKKIRTIISLFLLLACVFTLTACGNEEKKEEKEQKEEVKEEIVITLDTDGGDAVQNIKIEKGKTTTLPETKKEGYTFEGWYLDDKKIDADYVYETDVTLKAKWKKIEVKPKTFTVSFDSNGGSKVNSITVECGKTLPTLPKPKKDFYEFVSWADKHGKVILKGALLSCENVTLYANWEYDGPVANPEQNTPKTYTCPEGYYLDGTDKCSTIGTVREKCEGQNVFEYEGKCVTINGSSRKDPNRGCKKEHVTYMSYAGETEGKALQWGNWGCAYYKTNDSNKSTCESHGFTWVVPENACYVKWIGNSTINTCDTNYLYVPNPNQFSGVNGMNGGCFPTKAKTQYCDDGYKFITGSCVKTIDATLK